MRLSGLGAASRASSRAASSSAWRWRARSSRPKVLLLDEPLGALDRRLRQEMQVELKAIQREIGVTTIFVTHDQEEALTLSDRIAIINQGRLVQVGAPVEVYERPAHLFAARFLGDANILRGTVVDRSTLRLADGTLILSASRLLRWRSSVPRRSPCCRQRRRPPAMFSSARSFRRSIPVPASPTAFASLRSATSRCSPSSSPRAGDVLTPAAPVLARWSPEQTVPLQG